MITQTLVANGAGVYITGREKRLWIQSSPNSALAPARSLRKSVSKNDSDIEC